MTTVVALARHLPDPAQATLRPAWRWMRRVARWLNPESRHRADAATSHVNYRLTRGRRKVRTVWDEMDELDPQYFLEATRREGGDW